MSDNLFNKSGDVREDELSCGSGTEGSDIEVLSDFSSDSSANYLPDDEYESDDSRHSLPKTKRPKTLPPSRLGPSTSTFVPLAVSTLPSITTGHFLSSEDEDDDVGVSVQPPVLPPVHPPATPWVRVYDGEPAVDTSSEFTVKNPGPRYCPPSLKPIDFFNLFVTEGFLIMLVRETNIYAQLLTEKLRRANKLTPAARLSTWVNVSLDEMKKYIAIILLMGIFRMKRLADYWSMHPLLQFPMIKSLMSLRRFEAVSSALHMTSRRPLPKGTPGYDPWVKIRPFLDSVNQSFVQHYAPNQNLSLGESMIGMKNRSIFIQYMPNKRHARYGIKKFELVDTKTMYVVQISLYSGKDFLENKPGPFTQKVVIDLLEKGRCLNKGYHVFTDNFYTKLPLASELLDKKTFLTGTINKISKGLPKSLVTSKFTVGEPVNYRQDKLLVVGFKEKPTRKPVFLMSTACEAASGPVRSSRGRVRAKPVIIQRYNKFMGGEDCKDKSLYHVSCTRPTKKYWKKIFFNLLDTCIQNSYVLYRLKSEGIDRPLTRTKYLLSIIQSLIGEDTIDQLPSTSTSIHDNSAEHFITQIPNRNRKLCPVCNKNAYYWCPGCNCGVHKLCFHKLEHKYRPKYSVRKPKQPSESDSD